MKHTKVMECFMKLVFNRTFKEIMQHLYGHDVDKDYVDEKYKIFESNSLTWYSYLDYNNRERLMDWAVELYG